VGVLGEALLEEYPHPLPDPPHKGEGVMGHGISLSYASITTDAADRVLGP
jgi:hypothetical protein